MSALSLPFSPRRFAVGALCAAGRLRCTLVSSLALGGLQVRGGVFLLGYEAGCGVKLFHASSLFFLAIVVMATDGNSGCGLFPRGSV